MGQRVRILNAIISLDIAKFYQYIHKGLKQEIKNETPSYHSFNTYFTYFISFKL